MQILMMPLTPWDRLLNDTKPMKNTEMVFPRQNGMNLKPQKEPLDRKENLRCSSVFSIQNSDLLVRMAKCLWFPMEREAKGRPQVSTSYWRTMFMVLNIKSTSLKMQMDPW